jgi:hypothetical protein
VYCFALLGFKLSLLASYLRIAGLLKRSRVVIQVVMTLVTINQIAFTCALSFACHPVTITPPISRGSRVGYLQETRLASNGT